MLSETELREWQYNLEPVEVRQVAAIARKATDNSSDGVSVLIVYLQEAMHRIAKEGKETAEIHSRMERTISELSKEYPPGKGLDDGQKDVKEALAKLEKKGQDQGVFEHKPTYLCGSSQ